MKVIYIIFGLTTMCLLFTSTSGRKNKSANQKMQKKKGRSMAGQNMKSDFDNRHQDVPKTPMELSDEVMTKLFKTQVEAKGGIPTMEIMYKLDQLRGVPRLQTLLMFEKMDKNANGMIDRQEFINMFGPASSAPHRAFRALFRLFDYDNNQFISIWETVQNEASIMGFDFDLTELGKKAEQKFRGMDANGDGKVSEDEFIAYMNLLGVTSIGKVKNISE